MHLHEKLLDEFDRLRKLGVKFNMAFLLQLAQYLNESLSSASNASSTMDTNYGRRISTRVTNRYIQSFRQAKSTVSFVEHKLGSFLFLMQSSKSSTVRSHFTSKKYAEISSPLFYMSIVYLKQIRHIFKSTAIMGTLWQSLGTMW